MLFNIAWRNLWRNPLRSLVIIGSVMTGLWAGIFILAFFRGMINEQIDTSIKQQFSHIQVHHPKFQEDEAPEFTVLKKQTLLRALSANPAIAAFSERVRMTGMASSAYSSTGITILGVNPAAEAAVTQLNKRIASGAYFDSNSSNQIMIGRKLAEKLHLAINNKIILTFQDKQAELITAAFRIRGIYTAANSGWEESFVYLRANDLDALTPSDGTVQEIAILLHQNSDLETVATSLRKSQTGNTISTWKELSPELRLMIDYFGQYMLIIIGIILIALVFGIINTMLMAVLERYRELGVLMAIGLNKKKIFGMILLETLLMTIIGCIAGLPLARLTIFLTARTGIDLSRFSEGLAMYGYGNQVFPQLDGIFYVEIAAMTVFASLFAAVYPAIKALKLEPATAIRKI